MADRLLYETHSHTPLCRHASGTPSEYAQAAYERGLAGLIVTCHNPMPDGFASHVRMREHEFEAYLDLVDQARRHWAGRLDVRLGLEADYFPGYEDYLERQLRSAVFHYVLGSVHPQLREYRDRFWREDPVEFQVSYFSHLADAAETGLFDCLAHPDLIKNQTAEDWVPERIMGAIDQSLARIAKTGVAMELNTSGRWKAIAEMNPFPEMLRLIRKYEIPIVIGADAHVPERVGEGFDAALALLRECGFESVHYFVERQLQTVPLSKLDRSHPQTPTVNLVSPTLGAISPTDSVS